MIFVLVLILLNYNNPKIVGFIILSVNTSFNNWGAVFDQFFNKKHTITYYKSGLWNMVEQNYNITKQKCKSILKTLRKV